MKEAGKKGRGGKGTHRSPFFGAGEEEKEIPCLLPWRCYVGIGKATTYFVAARRRKRTTG